jgi:hypothetical protein
MEVSYRLQKFFFFFRRFIYNTYPVLLIRIRDPVPFYPKDPGSGSGIRDDFFSGSRISDPGFLPHPKFKILPLKMKKNRKN